MLGKVNFSNEIRKQPAFPITTVCHCFQEASLSYWSERSSASHPAGKTAYVFTNTENAGMVRKIFILS